MDKIDKPKLEKSGIEDKREKKVSRHTAEERCRADGVQEMMSGSRTYRCWRDERSLREIYSHE